MSNDIERLLAAAADDTDQPLHTDIDDILARGRRSVRRTRIAVASTAVLTTLAIVGGLTVWSKTLQESEGPARTPKSETITVDAKTGRITDNETGIQATLPPPASPLSDAAVLKRCRQFDTENVQANRERGSNTYDKAGPINAGWRVLVKSGDQKRLEALFLAPDRSIVSLCSQKDERGEGRSGRFSMSILPYPKEVGFPEPRPQVVEQGVQVPAAGVAHVLVSLAGEAAPRQALVGPDGFFTLGFPEWDQMHVIDPKSKAWDNYEPTVQRIRGYDANGKRVYDWKYVKVEPPKPTQIPADVKIKTAAPIEPRTVLTKDPENGKPLTVVPFSPLSDEQVRTECKKPDDSFVDGAGSSPDDSRLYDAGRISPDWQVALKVGSDKRFTALFVSPGQNVLVWCYRAEQSAYDYTRSGVKADGTFGDPTKDEFNMWAQVPDGVAQIIVDLPTGPVRAAISNGYYLWGTTGGNENFKKVRVRGFDADAKLIYDQKITVDAS